jgi:putative transposase
MKKQGLQQRKTRWTHYQTGYHFVWIPKYRKKILVGEVQKELKNLIHECADKNGLSIIAIETDIDHVHVFLSAPPRYSPALIANLLKGYTSRMLRLKSPLLQRKCGKDKLWTSAYYVGTAGLVSSETIIRYITECQGK